LPFTVRSIGDLESIQRRHGALPLVSDRARWVSPVSSARFRDVVAVEAVVEQGRIEIGSRSASDVRVRTTVSLSGWRARLAHRRPAPLPEPTVDDGVLRIRAERGLVRVQIDVPDGCRVQAVVNAGDLTMWGAAGDLDLRVGKGILAGRDLTASSVRAVNGVGEVNLHFAAVPTTVDAATASGAVLLVLPEAAYRVDTMPGAQVTVPLSDDARSTVNAYSGSDNVSVLVATGSEPI
jgi:hypothetical protein